MNQSSLSVSDVSKSNALLQTGVSDSKSSPQSDESESFLSALGAIFQSDSEIEEDVKVSKANTSEVEIEGQSIDELIDAEGEEGKILSSTAEESSDDVDPKLKLAEELPEDKKVAKTMSEGNELLGRLDESNQALKKDDGKPLPLDSNNSVESPKISVEDLEKNPELSRFIEKSTDQKQNDLEEENHQHLNSQFVADKRVIEQDDTVVDEAQIKHDHLELRGESEQTNYIPKDTPHDQSFLANQPPQSNADDMPTDETEIILASKMAEGVAVDRAAQSASNNKEFKPSVTSLELNQAKITPSEELVWDNNPIIASPENLTDTSVYVEENVGKAALIAPTPIDKAQLEAVMAELNLSDVPLEQLSAEELEYVAQMVSSNALPEQLRGAAEVVKPSAIATATAQQLHSPQYLQQNTAQAVVADKALTATQAPVTAAELNAAQLNQIQSFNPTPQLVANNANSQQQMMKAALAATGAVNTLKSSDKSENKESNLSQQLSGLAAQQGVQQAQHRADLQQIVQQSPLQLSRDVAGEKLSEQVQMMLSKNLKNIDIRLDPPELGRMQIRMSMNGDAASVQFTVANQQARDMVEQAMPRLREMLAQQGIQLSGSTVQQQNAGQQQGQYASNEADNGNGTRGSSLDGDRNVDESINLDVNIKSKDDGISFYA